MFIAIGILLVVAVLNQWKLWSIEASLEEVLDEHEYQELALFAHRARLHNLEQSNEPKKKRGRPKGSKNK